MTGKGRRIAAALVLGGVVLAAGWGLWVVRPVLAPFLMAIVIAYLVAPPVNALTQRGLSRGVAIALVYTVLLGSGAVAISKLVPGVLSETRRLAEAIPTYALRAQELVDGFQQRVHDLGVPPSLRDVMGRHITEMEGRSMGALDSLLDPNSIQKVAGLLLSLLLAPVLAIYLLKDQDRFKERFVSALPRRYRMEILALLRGLDAVLAGFVRGQLMLAVVVGAMAALATTVLGLRYALLLGIWAGLTEFIPFIGPVLGAVPAVLAGLSESPLLALEVALAFAIIQQIENAVLQPKIMGETVGLHPLAVMLSALAAGYLWGTWGLILALPVVGAARVLWCFIIARLTERPMPE